MNILGKISQYILILNIFLLPVLFLPLAVSSFSATKITLIAVGSLLALLLFSINKLKDDSFKFSFNILNLSLILIPLIAIVSAIFSNNVYISFFGRGFAIDNVLFILMLTLLTFLVYVIFPKQKDAIKIYFTLAISIGITFTLFLINSIFPNLIPPLGFFFDTLTTTVGRLNDVAILAGIGLILSLISLEMFNFSKLIKMGLYILGTLSLLTLVIINYGIVWYLVGLFSIFTFVYLIVFKRSENVTKFPYISIGVFLISLVFILAGALISGLISNFVSLDYVEARPSLETTFSLIQESAQTQPVLGSGPNRFNTFWDLNRPDSVNFTDFWANSFSFGFGYILTLAISQGILGILVWLLFLGTFIFYGVKNLFKKGLGVLEKYILVSSFVTSLYLWLINIIYVSGAVILGLTFIFTGITIASFYREKIFKYKTIALSENPKAGFVFIFLMVLFLIASVVGIYHYTTKFLANNYYQRGALAFQEGNLNNATIFFGNAYSLSRNDVYLQSLANVEVNRISQILNSNSLSQEDQASQFRNSLSNAISFTDSAIAFDDQNYNNYILLANIYEAIIPLGVQGAYEEASRLYNLSLEHKPNNPAVYLSLARLEFTREENDAAREFIKQALNSKPNFTEAIFLLSQIEVSEGNIQDAITNVSQAVAIRPNDPNAYFQLGLLHYQTEEFNAAIRAFENAVILNPFFSNAKYFLGLSYENDNRVEDAILQFEDLLFLNPENQEVQFILDNLKQGNSPFFGAQPPLDEAPEDRQELPLEDEEPSEDSEELIEE